MRATFRAEVSIDPPQVQVRYRCQVCSSESTLRRSVLNPSTITIFAGIPLFAFTFCTFGYLLPGSFGFLQWLAATVGGAMVAKAGVLLIERCTYTFAPAGGSDA